MATATETKLGRDTSCTSRLFAGRTVEGARLLAESDFRRLTSERGSVLDAPNYGLPITSLLNAAMSESELRSVPGRIRNELDKDDRHRREATRVTIQRDPTERTAFLVGVHGETEQGEGFDMVLRVADVVELLAVGT